MRHDDEQGKKVKKQKSKPQVQKVKPSRSDKTSRTESHKKRRIARAERAKDAAREKWRRREKKNRPMRGDGRLARRGEIISRNRPKREREKAAAHRRAVLAWQVFKAENPEAVMRDFLAEFHRVPA